MYFFLICTSLIVFIVSAVKPEPKPLPQKFTQAFTLWSKDDDLQCQGKIFYDSQTLSQKVMMVGNSKDCCGETSATCSGMLINGTGYVIQTQQKDCCYFPDLPPSIPRDIIAQEFQFRKEVKIDGNPYYLWIREATQFPPIDIGIFTDQTDKRIMKRIIISIGGSAGSKDLFVDFWEGSYSEKFSEKTTFEVPKYCKEQCQFYQSGTNSSFYKGRAHLLSKIFGLNFIQNLRDQ